MSAVLESLGLPDRAPRAARHRKLTESMISLLQQEAKKRADLVSYERLAVITGLSHGSVRVLMGQLIREAKSGAARVHRGTDKRQSDDLLNGREW